MPDIVHLYVWYKRDDGIATIDVVQHYVLSNSNDDMPHSTSYNRVFYS